MEKFQPPLPLIWISGKGGWTVFRLTGNGQHGLAHYFCEQLYQPNCSSQADVALVSLQTTIIFSRSAIVDNALGASIFPNHDMLIAACGNVYRGRNSIWRSCRVSSMARPSMMRAGDKCRLQTVLC
jgi:hypothetical protein